MSADYDDGWGASDYDDGWGARRLDGSVPRRVAHDDGWGQVPAHQRAEQDCLDWMSRPSCVWYACRSLSSVYARASGARAVHVAM